MVLPSFLRRAPVAGDHLKNGRPREFPAPELRMTAQAETIKGALPAGRSSRSVLGGPDAFGIGYRLAVKGLGFIVKSGTEGGTGTIKAWPQI
jgi:hypothetical protein